MRKGHWKKNGKGIRFKSFYMPNHFGARTMVLVGFHPRSGEVQTYTAESWQALKSMGWVRV